MTDNVSEMELNHISAVQLNHILQAENINTTGRKLSINIYDEPYAEIKIELCDDSTPHKQSHISNNHNTEAIEANVIEANATNINAIDTTSPITKDMKNKASKVNEVNIKIDSDDYYNDEKESRVSYLCACAIL